MQKQIVTLPMGGRNRETVQHADGEDVRVSYDYDPVGQVTTVHHPNGTQTTYKLPTTVGTVCA